MNGTVTNNDRTNYFENVPTAALDQVLWPESVTAWAGPAGAIDKARLDEQRGVVQNEMAAARARTSSYAQGLELQ
ncbi:hypothetical protein ACRAWD_21860 [Caulobacter segnis]